MNVFLLRRCLWAALLLPFLAGCGDKAQPQTTARGDEVFGTQVSVVINDIPEAEATEIIGEVFAHWRNMNTQFHAWKGDGELVEINRAMDEQRLPVTVSESMATAISLAVTYSWHTNGNFNPAAGRLFALWGFHSDSLPARPPPEDELAAYLAKQPDMRDVDLRERVLVGAPLQTKFDFGALIKGVALDNARDILRSHNVKNALIVTGGNIMVLGENHGRPWRIRLHPSNYHVSLADGEAVATSGGNPRYFEYEGRRYTHILDTRTGQSADNIAAATAISSDPKHAGAISDAASTALVIANEEQAEYMIDNFKLAAGLQVAGEGESLMWAGMEARIRADEESQ